MKNLFPSFLLVILSASLAAQNVGIGTETPMATLDVHGDVIFEITNLIPEEGVNYALDVNTDRSSVYRVFGPDYDFSIAGMSAGVDGRVITLLNLSGVQMTMINEDPFALPAEQIVTASGNDLVLGQFSAVTLIYDAYYEKWIVRSANKASPDTVWSIVDNNAVYNTGGNVGIGTDTPLATLHVNGDIIFQSGDLNIGDGITLDLDVNTIRYSFYRISGPVDSFAIGGITAAYDGRMITLLNRTGFAMRVVSEDPAASPENRIITGTEADLIIEDHGMITLQYDEYDVHWVVRSTNTKSHFSDGIWNAMGENAVFENGFVGIGTEAPVSPLTIETVDPSVGLTQIGGPEAVTLTTEVGENSASIGTTSDHMLSLKTGGTAKLFVTPSGNVVIGDDPSPFGLTGLTGSLSRTPLPGAKLTVETPLNTTGWLHIGATEGSDSIIVDEAIGGVSASVGTLSNHSFRLKTNALPRMTVLPDGRITVGDNNVQPLGQFTVFTEPFSDGIVHASTDGFKLASHRGMDSGTFGTYSPHHFRLICNSQSALNIISPSLNVGIGIDYPPEKLTVQTPDNTFGISHRSTGGIILATHVGVSSASIGTHSLHNFRLVTNGITRLHISADGKIGIGTINPVNLFEVKGTMRAQELIIETANWPDYVFNEEYTLMSLPELREYILAHNHLPGVIPASEVEENGFKVGATQKQMLEKIEELTLYILQLQEEIDQLKHSNSR